MGAYYADGAVTPLFSRMMVTLASLLGTDVTEAQIRAHAQLFDAEGVPPDVLRRAFHRAATELPNGFYPSPGRLLDYVRPSERDAATLAWAAFRQAAGSVGAWSDVVVDDPAAAAALALACGSWPEFCAMEEGPELAQRRKEFFAAYQQIRRLHGTAPARLPGLCGAAPGSSAVGRITAFGEVTVAEETPRKRLEDGHAAGPEA